MLDINRNLEGVVNQLLQLFQVVIILGVRQCGKTTLAKKLRPEWTYIDLEKGNDFDRVTRDFDFFFKENPQHLIIDEAQRSPKLFQELRGIIDADREQKNRFILTGSSSPELIKNVSESLAGRIGIIELGTFKINELHAKPLPPFYQIFSSPLSHETIEALRDLKPSFTHDQIMMAFLKGGYPEPCLSKKQDFIDVWMNQYFQTYIQRDIRSLFPRLDLIKYQRFISMLSALSGTIINKSELGRSLDTSEVTVRDYLDIAHGSYLWRKIPSYEKSLSKSIVKMPKGIMRDSGLVHFIQQIKTREQLNINPHVGTYFESFIIEEIIKGLHATLLSKWDYSYYRTRNGAEIDLVLHGDFGTLPIEIKFGSDTRLKQLSSLKQFITDHNLPLGIVVNNSDEVALLTEGIVQIPAGML
jgi:uncharacterized protein